jgi:hypothetical protein
VADHPASGLPDYFALFQSLLAPGAAAPASAQSMFAMLDPKELEKKIGEMETVLAWLKATTGVVEFSLQTMKQQHALLSGLAGKKAPGETAPGIDPVAMEKLAAIMNPAVWAMHLMPGSAANAPAARDGVAAAKPRKARTGARKR